MKIENLQISHIYTDRGSIKITTPYFILADRVNFEDSVKQEGLLIHDCTVASVSQTLVFLGFLHFDPLKKKIEELEKLNFLQYYDNYIAGSKLYPIIDENETEYPVKIIGKKEVPWLIIYNKGNYFLVNSVCEKHYENAFKNPYRYFPDDILQNINFQVSTNQDEGWSIIKP